MATPLLAEDNIVIPVQETSENTILVGWRPKKAGTAFLDIWGSDKIIAFGEKGDIAINNVLLKFPNRKVLAIVSLLAPTSAGSNSSSAVCGAWVIFEPLK